MYTNSFYRIKGDVNLDGKIDDSDLTLIKLHIFQLIELKGDALWAADVNDDGIVDIVDSAAVRAHILGKEQITEIDLKGVVE